MNLQAVKGAGNGDARQGAKNMYKMMRQLEENGTMSTGILRLQDGDRSVSTGGLDYSSSSSTGGPSTTVSFEPPWIEEMRRGYLGNVWDWAKQPTPIPTQQYAGLDPYELQARGMVGGLGGFQPYIEQAGGAYGQGLGATGQGIQAGYYGAQGYDPAMGKSFYNPYEEDVVQQSLARCLQEFCHTGCGSTCRCGGTRCLRWRSWTFDGGRKIQSIRKRHDRGSRRATPSRLYFSTATGAKRFCRSTGKNAASWTNGHAGCRNVRDSLEQGLAGIGQMGQNMLMNQINLTNTLGSQARGIADKRLAAQYQTATGTCR